MSITRTANDEKMNLVFEVLSGSHAYGLATEAADEDVRGVYLPPERGILGFGYRDTITLKPDIQYHSLKKYLHLCLKANPSMLAWLWVRPDFIRHNSLLNMDLRCDRHRLLSKLVHKTFGGYAVGQMKKMEKSYGSGKGYALHGERNAEKDIYSRYAGYDTKNAMHLIRLLRCGVELLETGEYNVYRYHDRDMLLEIRHGEWTIEQVLAEAQRWFDEMDSALENSPLPDKPDREWAEAILMDAHMKIINKETL
jgi:uncharacterized protein